MESSTEGPSRKQRQELDMEELSEIGAPKIASLDIPERAKRAMLAEAIEDRIFDLTDELELVLAKEDTVPNRELIVELAQQTKLLQIQYQDLVTGKSSTLLQSIDRIA
jgi:hypothetical protein